MCVVVEVKYVFRVECDIEGRGGPEDLLQLRQESSIAHIPDADRASGTSAVEGHESIMEYVKCHQQRKTMDRGLAFERRTKGGGAISRNREMSLGRDREDFRHGSRL